MKPLPPFAGSFRGSPLIAAIAAAIVIAAGCGPTNNLPELSGEFAYVANAGDGTISVFSIDTTTGALTFIQSVSVKPGFQVFGLAMHWFNEFLYSTIDDANEVEEFDIGDGSFSGQIFASMVRGRSRSIPWANTFMRPTMAVRLKWCRNTRSTRSPGH
jgi:DNA-binding beta-propeller fold protein YncE